jgi:uncharacterized protein YraI
MKKISRVIVAFALLLALSVSLFHTSASAITTTERNRNEIYSQLVARGLTKAQACGILANIEYESSYNPNAWYKNISYGLCQWQGDRLKVFQDTYKTEAQRASIYNQISYLFTELRGKEKNAYNKSIVPYTKNTADEAYNVGYMFCLKFERPLDQTTNPVKRGNKAKELFAMNFTTTTSSSSAKKSSTKTSTVKKIVTTTVSKLKTYTTGRYKTTSKLKVRTGATTSSKSVGVLKKGANVTVKSVKSKKWGKITYKKKSRYVSLDYAKKV